MPPMPVDDVNDEVGVGSECRSDGFFSLDLGTIL